MNFTYSEAIHPRYIRHIKPELVIDNNITHEGLLIRLLSGTVKVTNNFNGDTFSQNKNYSILGAPTNQIISTKIIRDIIADYSLETLGKYLKQSKRHNSKFYLNLLEELASYFHKSTKGAYTTAFVHLYRVLEYISYSFPLVYASKTRDYNGSYSKLKDFFSGINKGELGFFKTFIDTAISVDLSESIASFQFNTINPAIDRNHYSVFKQMLTDAQINNFVENSLIEIRYEHLFSLAINLRNRYFHFLTGGLKNISPIDIVENDAFFKLINEELVNWISVVYFEILIDALDTIE